MEKLENIEAYISHLTKIKNEMSLNGKELKDSIFVTKVLNSLPMNTTGNTAFNGDFLVALTAAKFITGGWYNDAKTGTTKYYSGGFMPPTETSDVKFSGGYNRHYINKYVWFFVI